MYSISKNRWFKPVLYSLLIATHSFTLVGCNSDTSSDNNGGAGVNVPPLDNGSSEVVPGKDYAANPVSLSSAWANDGGEKVTRAELRGTNQPSSVANSLWNGSKIQLFGAKKRGYFI